MSWRKSIKEDTPVAAKSWKDSIQEDATDISRTESLLRGAAQGATFNTSDELVGAVSAAMPSALQNNPALAGEDLVELGVDVNSGESFMDTYRRVRDESREANKLAETTNPGTYFTGEVLGGIAVPVPLAGAAVSGTKGLAKVATLAKAGAVGGGLAAAGSTEATDALDMAKDVGSGAAVGAIAAPVLGSAVGKLANYAGEVAQQSNLGRQFVRVFSKSKEGQVQRAAEVVEAKANKLSDEAIEAVKNKPRFGSTDYYKSQMVDFTKDTEKYIQDFTNPKLGSGGVAGFRNEAYQQVALEAKKADVQLATDELLGILQPKEGSRNADAFTSISDDILETIGSKLEIDPAALKNPKLLKQHQNKLMDQIQKAEQKVEVDIKNKSIDKAKQIVSGVDKDPTLPARSIADNWLEANRVKLHTRAMNEAEKEANGAADMFFNPGKFLDFGSDVAPDIQAATIKSRGAAIIQQILPDANLADAVPNKLTKELVDTMGSNKINSINKSIADSFELVPSKDPDTARTVFTAMFKDDTGKIVSKPISMGKDLDPTLASQSPKQKADYVMALAKRLADETKQGIADAKVEAKLRVQTLPSGSKLLTAEIPTAEAGKTQLLSTTIPNTVEVPTVKVAASNKIGYEDMQSIKSLVNQRLEQLDLPAEVRKKLMEVKSVLSNATATNAEIQKALQTANKFKVLESTELNRITSMPMAALNRMSISDRDMYNKTIQTEAKGLANKLFKAGAREASPEAADIDLLAKGLDQAQELGMKSAPKLKEDLSGLVKTAEDLETQKAMFDRQELPGGFVAMLQRLGMSATSAILKGSSIAGSITGKVAGSGVAKSGVAQGINKLIALNPEDLTALANRTTNPVLKKYLMGMANADGPKRKAVAFAIAQQPGIRESFREMFPDLDGEEN